LDGNDYIQSIFTAERHRHFDREVEKDRLAQLASPPRDRPRVRRVARWLWTIMSWTLRRGNQRRVQRAPMSIP
jgi:hypothetical protein